MAVTIKAIFLGKNNTRDFIKGELYVLTIHESRVVSPRHIPYESVEAFLKNWLPVADSQHRYFAPRDIPIMRQYDQAVTELEEENE